MPEFDSKGRLIAITERERLALPDIWPEIANHILPLPDGTRRPVDEWRAELPDSGSMTYFKHTLQAADYHIQRMFEEATLEEMEASKEEERRTDITRAEVRAHLAGLPQRVVNLLWRNQLVDGTKTRSRIAAMTDEQILALRNSGIGTLRALREWSGQDAAA